MHNRYHNCSYNTFEPYQENITTPLIKPHRNQVLYIIYFGNFSRKTPLSAHYTIHLIELDFLKSTSPVSRPIFEKSWAISRLLLTLVRRCAGNEFGNQQVVQCNDKKLMFPINQKLISSNWKVLACSSFLTNWKDAPYKAIWQISKLTLMAINTSTKLLLLRMKYIIDGDYFFDNSLLFLSLWLILAYFIISMRKLS